MKDLYFIQDGGQKEVKRMESGSYFGELALLTKEPRKATCKVVSKEATAGGKRFNISHKNLFYNTNLYQIIYYIRLRLFQTA